MQPPHKLAISCSNEKLFHVKSSALPIKEDACAHFIGVCADNEEDISESFNSLSIDNQRLFIQLNLRKGPWFPLSEISYSEISNVGQATEDVSVCS